MDVQTCMECTKKFSDVCNLRKHIKKNHPENNAYLASLQVRKNRTYNFSCTKCHRNFNYSKHLKFHLKKIHNEKEGNRKAQHQCVICSNFVAEKQTVLQHYRDFHNISIADKKMVFQTEEEFNTWKLTFENASNSQYIIQSRKTCKTHVSIDYVCHRSGKYVSKGKNIRHLKILGSQKINGLCPASLKVKKLNNGTCEVTHIETHVGHKNDIGHLNLSKVERDYLAMKIASKVSFDDILDEIRDSITDSELKRLHLITKKDLYNIESCFNLSSKSVRHKNDVISVESWINEMQSKEDAVLFYKPQGCEDEEWPLLRKEDFVLIIMTAAQCEMLKMYGTDCICIDGTHGMNNYDFELITLLVVDDIRQGFPCSFLISNRSDKEVLKVFFHFVKVQLETTLSPNVFMSDMADSFYNAWVEIMSPPKLRLYCTWHVDQAWRKNLPKIKNKEKQAFVYQNLRTILEERDSVTFNILIKKLYTILLEDPDTAEFANYFASYYMNCTQLWAYCHRLGAGINTNMHLERMHKTLKYTYLKGKKVKRLDKAINAIMRFVRDKCIDRLIVINKRKLSSKLQLIRSRHKTSLSLRDDLVIPCENGWNIASETSEELYLVQRIKENCKCQLTCTECKICIHQYCCSCVDCSVKYNMCKHIHLLMRSIANTTDTLEVRESVDTDDNNLIIVEDNEPREIEAEMHLKELSSNTANRGFATRKEKLLRLLENLHTYVSSTMNEEELEVIEKAVAPIKYTLAAVERNTGTKPKANANEPHNKHIHKQRFQSTRKKITKQKVRTQLKNTALSLLL